jgi:acyl-CoA synthetase (AMP-forming)/AMP-acid ligase II
MCGGIEKDMRDSAWESIDFDPELQRVFEGSFTNTPGLNWKKWLDVSSAQEYEELVYKLTGLSADNLEDVGKTVTDPDSISMDSNLALTSSFEDDGPHFLCHTSGTSGGDISSLKWFHLSKDLIRQVWAPGMKAIFDSGGLVRDSSAAIFIPSRIKNDGLDWEGGAGVVRLYTSEFSQRLVLALIKPKGYLFEFYKNSRSLTTLQRLLSMRDISVVSAPYLTILGWIDPVRMRRSIEESFKTGKDGGTGEELREVIRKHGLDKASIILQERLQEKLRNATLIFSSTGLSETDWKRIRAFFGWEEGGEKFINLYVGSETGPFAANIDGENKRGMVVFPLT